MTGAILSALLWQDRHMTRWPLFGAARQEMQPCSPHLLTELSLPKQKQRREKNLLFVRPLAVIAHDPIRINKYWRYAARSPAHCALKTELSASPHHGIKSMSSITRKGRREPGRISAPGDSRV